MPFLLLGSWLFFAPPLWAQGTFQGLVVRTGGGQAMVSAVQPIPAFPGTNASSLELQFGFATDEVFAPSNIFDSVTITLQDDARTATLILVTADASGVVWAPPSPGTIPLDPNAITHSVIPFPALQPVLASQAAFQVSVPLPAQFNGVALNLYLDLFDNLNSKTSLGFLSVTIVPEPTSCSLALCGGIALWLLGRRKK